MTTPSVDLNIAMPYGVTMEGDGTGKAKPVTNLGKRAGDNVTLPAGPCLLYTSDAADE